MNTIKIPEGIDFMAVCGHAMKNNLVEISGGLGPSAGKVWRIGVMGNNANTEVVSKVWEKHRPNDNDHCLFQVLAALKDALAAQGWKGAV